MNFTVHFTGRFGFISHLPSVVSTDDDGQLLGLPQCRGGSGYAQLSWMSPHYELVFSLS